MAPSVRTPTRPALRRRATRPRPAAATQHWEDTETAFGTAAARESRATDRPWHVSEAVGVALSILAVLVLLFVGYLFGWSNLQASRNQQRLLASYAAHGEFSAFHGRTPPDGAMVAVLSIPSIGLHQAVVEGTTSVDLESGPGLMPRTAVPGSIGDSVIAGRHGTFGSPFARISQLSNGSTVSVVDYEGRFSYRVDSVRTLGSSQPLRIARTKTALLTLVTSQSSFPPSGLVVVTATRVGKAGKPAASSAAVTPSELALGGDPAMLWQALGWTVGLALVLAASVVAYRRARLPVLVYVLSTPVVLVCALFAFENASRLLPATM